MNKDIKPEVSTAPCVVCKNGKITGEYKFEATVPFDMIPIGPASKSYYSWQFQGYHCDSCGVKYEFLPKT